MTILRPDRSAARDADDDPERAAPTASRAGLVIGLSLVLGVMLLAGLVVVG